MLKLVELRHLVLRSSSGRKENRRSFLWSVGVLVGGSGISQLIALMFLPLITRLYTPEDFTIFGVFSALVGILIPIAGLRLELAIPLAADDKEAARLLTLSLASAVVFTTGAIALALCLTMVGEQVSAVFGLALIHGYLWLLPVAVLAGGACSALLSWSTRKRQFSTVSKSRVLQTLAGSCTQLGWGLTWASAGGLVLGFVINSGAGAVILGATTLRGMTLRSVFQPLADLRATFYAHSRFPRFSVLEALLNNAAIGVPLIIVATYAAGPDAGHLSLAVRVLQVPLALIGVAVSQVYSAGVATRHTSGQLAPFSGKVLQGIALAGLGPLIAAAITAPTLFVLLFGPEWARSGEIVRLITPWLALQLLSTPLSFALYVEGRQDLALKLQAAGLLLRIAPVAIVGALAPAYLIPALAIGAATFYLLFLYALLKVIGLSLRQVSVVAFLRVSAAIVMWSAAGGLCLSFLRRLGLT